MQSTRSEKVEVCGHPGGGPRFNEPKFMVYSGPQSIGVDSHSGSNSASS